MSVVWTGQGAFRSITFASEAELEETIKRVQRELFGPSRIYLDVKRKIGARGGQRNIPDGYLIDLSGSKPRLYVVENELASHDPLRHIAVQILQFSISFGAEKALVKRILVETLQQEPEARAQCEAYVSGRYRNLDHLLEFLVFEAPFAALVVIDELPDDLEKVLGTSFKFGVEVLVLGAFDNGSGERVYHFEPFLSDIVTGAGPTASGRSPVDVTEIDTLVVPAREEGFRDVFLGENRWHAIRIHGTMRPQIKYIAAYQVAPVSAITHMAPVASIEPWEDSGKFVVTFSESAHEINPIGLGPGGRGKAPQNIRYTNRERLEAAKNLDDLW